MDWILDKITQCIAKNEKQDAEEIEIVRYGLEVLIMKILFFLIAIFIGIIIGKQEYCILFMLSFVPIRSLAGGYHADKRWKCALASLLMLALSIGLIYFSVHNSIVGTVIMESAPVILVALIVASPVETDNKPLGARRRKAVRKRLVFVSAVYTVLAVAGFMGQYYILGYSICVAIIMAFMLVLFGMVHNSRKQKHMQGAEL